MVDRACILKNSNRKLNHPQHTISHLNHRRRILWHTLPEREVYTKLEATQDGLTDEQVQDRQKEFGPNRLPTKVPPSVVGIFLHQFLSPLIYILLVAAVVSIFIGETTDAAFILAILLLNATLGTFQEWKAERSAAALQSLLQIHARVRGAGTEQELSAEELVPGDVCLLESGNRVPADLRLLDANNLAIDESLLTGESLAVAKTTSVISDHDAPISDRTNMAYAATTVMVGRAIGLVVATGLQTEVASIAKTVAATEETKPPLVVRMDQFARLISIGVLGACLLLALVAFSKGIPLTQVFFMAVALAVSAIPEGLPVAMTVALSVATSRMAKRHVIVRKLTAVEGLGSCTFIASDKTGTLTVNQQTVKTIVLPPGESFTVSGQGYTGDGAVVSETHELLPKESCERLKRLGTVGVLCNEAQLSCEKGQWIHHGDAVDIALLALGYKLDLNPPRLRRAVTTLGVIPLQKDVIEEKALRLAEQGYRVMALAEGELVDHPENGLYEQHCLPSLTFLGLIGSIDPLRPEAH